MPIWFELIFLLLITYTVGLAIGWMLWGNMRNGPDSVGATRTGDNK